ncbi:MAG: hypothetical protein ACHQIK_14360 [Candidatus Acidiferrales bacterium]
MKARNSEKDRRAGNEDAVDKTVLAERGADAIDAFSEGLGALVSFFFNGFGSGELAVDVGFRARST